ncbi:Bicarbonate transport system permease protein CmpB [Kingella potus]|uniref:Bicarbonate transport system permease protein CmpB n=1 Tax=Kingella potus TaxID=265175 RepID=A0A377QWW5_9NEIS|nr:ABC transporter permease subunit [Kingella potus]UOP01794.1 ABC transporter permease subunit [Kingella potus]STQ99894.1 Bicarbonate transport system permease protein CmpB [Kingella potus]
MIKTDKIRKPQPVLFYIADYLWSGFAGLGVAMAAVALWAWGSEVFGGFMLPPPLSVFEQAWDLLRQFQTAGIGVSLWRAAAGIGIALAAGVAAGLLAGRFKTAMALLKPVMTILLAMPPIVWVVMALFWFGFGNPGVLFTVVVLVTPLTFSGAAVGMAGVDKKNEELFDAYRLGLVKKIRYLYLPHLTGYLISSVGVAVAMGVKVVIMAELLGADEGIGAKIADARAMLETSTVMAYVVLVVAFVALFEYLVIKPLEILFMPWRR